MKFLVPGAVLEPSGDPLGGLGVSGERCMESAQADTMDYGIDASQLWHQGIEKAKF